MEVLTCEQKGRDPGIVLMFGLGMIGTAIRDALIRLQYRIAARLPFNWDEPQLQVDSLECIARLCHELSSRATTISITWSAGRADFFSAEEELDSENQSFAHVVQLARKLKQEFGQDRVVFHYLSSGGGLFEGQRIVDSASLATPSRPYGLMKLDQEKSLQEMLDSTLIHIYRPSSVYGPVVHFTKHGLINHLIANTYNRRTSVLDSRVMALRDYVYVGDIGEYIARKLALRPGDESRTKTHFLVSGRCASIFEVVSRIERILNLRVRFRIDEGFGNSANITFSNHVLPIDWRPSTLEVGIRRFMLKDQPQSRALIADAAVVT
jgi:nucleoside-diphosphate-sugar epimerase